MATTAGIFERSRRVLGPLRRSLVGQKIFWHVDSPAQGVIETCLRTVTFRGWAVARGGKPVSIRVLVDGQPVSSKISAHERPDVFALYHRTCELPNAICGFDVVVDLYDAGVVRDSIIALEFREGDSCVTSALWKMHLNANIPFSRGEYKDVWNVDTQSIDHARLVIAGHLDEDAFRAAGQWTRELLEQTVGINAHDTVLEIGCGIGRVGEALAPRCKEWIGCDVSKNMLGHLKRRLAHIPNIRTVELSGYDLRGVESCSVDVVYCTIVFPHLDEWERYRYVREAFRVLRPGGRLLVDNYNLLSSHGWEVFLSNEEYYHPGYRPPSVGRPSTPQELEAYLQHAGFVEIEQRCDDLLVYTWGKKAN